MIRDSLIQLYLRNMLIDGLEAVSLDIPVLYENVKRANLKGVYIVEQLFPLQETAYNDIVEDGSGLYKLTVMSDTGTGLQFTDLVDTIKGIFRRGTYLVSEDENVSICIDNPITGETLFQADSDKVQRSVSIEYRKFKS